MLAKPYRLTKERDFKRVNALGRSFFSPQFRVKVLANNSATTRSAIVTSAKLSKKAVVRNRLRRQLSEIIRLSLPRLATGYDLVVSVKSPAIDRDYQLLESDLTALLIKAKLLK